MAMSSRSSPNMNFLIDYEAKQLRTHRPQQVRVIQDRPGATSTVTLLLSEICGKVFWQSSISPEVIFGCLKTDTSCLLSVHRSIFLSPIMSVRCIALCYYIPLQSLFSWVILGYFLTYLPFDISFFHILLYDIILGVSLVFSPISSIRISFSPFVPLACRNMSSCFS